MEPTWPHPRMPIHQPRPVSLRVAGLIRPASVLQAGARHALADAAFLDEVLLQPANLPVEEIVGLMNQANGDVGHYRGGAGFAELAEWLKGHVGLVAKVAYKAGFLRVFFPEWKIAHPEEVAVIHQEFLEASPGHIRELDLCFLGGAGRLAAFGDVLLAGA